MKRFEGTKFQGVEDHWDKFGSFKEYDTFCLGWLKECQRILKDNGSICVIGSFHNIFRIGFHLQNLGFWILNDIIWHRVIRCLILLVRDYATPMKRLFGALNTKTAKLALIIKQ
ncbi:adenine-specific DNA methyltransferase [Helicobacter pylori]|nr:adenine-specific DNA methyltransferase [Helicobacter pylori]